MTHFKHVLQYPSKLVHANRYFPVISKHVMWKFIFSPSSIKISFAERILLILLVLLALLFILILVLFPQVNILVHATDILISKKELNRLKRLLKLYADQDHSRSTSKAADQPSVNKVLERTSAFHSEHIKDVTGKSSLRSEITEESILQDRAVKNLNTPDKIAKASTFSKVSSRGDARSTRPNKKSDPSDKDYDLDSDLTIFCSGTTYRIKDLENECLDNIEGSSCSKAKPVADSCGAQWDIFRRQDVPQLLEYLRRHCDESIPAFYNPMHVRFIETSAGYDCPV